MTCANFLLQPPLAHEALYHLHIMFSYRHSFHAGNHADVLKHLTQLVILRYLISVKDTPLLLADTHAGTGVYRLDSNDAQTSGEAIEGILPLWEQYGPGGKQAPEALQDYLELLASFNPDGGLRKYPGSPFITASVMRPQDQLRLFELHPTDGRLLSKHMDEFGKSNQIQVIRNNGFMGLKALLPPASRRGLVLMDPSYELKTDYGQVASCIDDALRRFATGCYMIWYPVIPRPEAHELPRKLKTMTQRAGRSWLHATLSIGRDEEQQAHPGLRASGVFVINPPFVLKGQLDAALPVVHQCLKRGSGAGWLVESSG